MKNIYIVGAGLSGLLAAYLVSQQSDAKVVILEQGDSFESRINTPHGSLISGVGAILFI